MKTGTRAEILRLIKERGSARPIELVQALGITPQAIHRHLKSLVLAGSLETRGRGPNTRYVLAGVPNFDAARRWFATGSPSTAATESWCETRDVFAARLPRLRGIAVGLSPNDAALLISIAGEIGNNAFDHNLGQWQDVPGCWFEAQATGGKVWLCIADRGQGMLASLSRAHPEIRDEQSALVTAFEKRVSGRAPEQRGNGLKFVRNIILQNAGRGIACRSGAALIDYGGLGSKCREELAAPPGAQPGAIVTIVWSPT